MEEGAECGAEVQVRCLDQGALPGPRDHGDHQQRVVGRHASVRNICFN